MDQPYAKLYMIESLQDPKNHSALVDSLCVCVFVCLYVCVCVCVCPFFNLVFYYIFLRTRVGTLIRPLPLHQKVTAKN